MPRNGSGGYSLPTNTWNPATNGVSATAADWTALINDVASAVQQSLSADGQTPVTGSINMGGNRLTGLAAGTATGHSLRWEQLFSQGLQADVAAGATVDIGAALSTLVNVTGTGTITSFGTNYNGPRFLRFAGVCTLTNSATLVLPGGANITTAAGDSAIAVPLGNPATGWRVAVFQKADGTSIVATPLADDSVTFAKLQNIATGTILGRSTAGTGDVEALTGAQATALLSAASETVSGRVELADATEAAAGTDGTRALSPLRLRDALAATGSAPIYACRAWVNFNGTGTVAIRASGNVSSITDNGVGDYTVNFATAMVDANYAAVSTTNLVAIMTNGRNTTGTGSANTASACFVKSYTNAAAAVDVFDCYVAIFR